LSHYMDTGMTAVMYALTAMREYRFNVLSHRHTPYNQLITNLKTVENSGYWVRYDAEGLWPNDITNILDQGQLDPNDISAEGYVDTTTTPDKSYILIKNNLRSAKYWDPGPTYLLQLKYTINIVEYTTTDTTQI